MKLFYYLTIIAVAGYTASADTQCQVSSSDVKLEEPCSKSDNVKECIQQTLFGKSSKCSAFLSNTTRFTYQDLNTPLWSANTVLKSSGTIKCDSLAVQSFQLDATNQLSYLTLSLSNAFLNATTAQYTFYKVGKIPKVITTSFTAKIESFNMMVIFQGAPNPSPQEFHTIGEIKGKPDIKCVKESSDPVVKEFYSEFTKNFIQDTREFSNQLAEPLGKYLIQC